MISAQEARQEIIWRKCQKDPFYFLEHFFKIRHPKRGAILLELRDAQRQTLEVWLKEDLSLVLKARQIGFSTLAAGLVLWNLFFHADRFIITLSRTERDAQKLKAKIDYGFARLPEWMLVRGPKVIADNLAKLEFSNGSSVEALPATDPARGESAYLIIVDEWAFFENPEQAWAAIEPATDIGGRVIALSTANGSGNLFHRMWIDATTGVNGFVPIFHSWAAVPERDKAWYEVKRQRMLPWILHQEYPTTPEEAFIKSGRPVFDIDNLDNHETEAPLRGYLQRLANGQVEFATNEDGPLRVWIRPELEHAYVIGADVAEGLEHGDFSSAHVIDVGTGEVVAKWHGHEDPDEFGSQVLFDLGRWYNNGLIGPEVNNHGFTTTTALNNAGYPNIYYRHTMDERTKKRTRKLGWRTQANTKPLLVDELAAALRFTLDEDGAIIEEPDIKLRCSETMAELRTFVRDERGKMHGSPHDDRVISLGIANQMRKFWHESRGKVDQGPAEGTFDWYVAQIRPERNKHEFLIGARQTRRHL